jgi:hypothetical protein
MGPRRRERPYQLHRELDGVAVGAINTDLTTGLDLTKACRLPANAGIAFQGPVKVGPFEIDGATARDMIRSPNPDGRSNDEVICPWVNGIDLMRRPRGMFIIDFGERLKRDAAMYEAPFELVLRNVAPTRRDSKRAKRAERWWQHGETVPGLRAAVAPLGRYIATTRLSPHRVFVWLPARTLPDSRLIAFAREDDYFFGVIHSRIHEMWSRHTAGAQRREAVSGFTYTPSTCFETFPFPDPTSEQRERVGEAARRLVELRDGWLNPPGLDPAELAKRTLTNLYNQRPTWLANAHADLDAAVFAAYGWPADLSDADILESLLGVNRLRTVGP